jgi:hypothetical protein
LGGAVWPTTDRCVMNKRRLLRRIECFIFKFVAAAITFEALFLIHEIVR